MATDHWILPQHFRLLGLYITNDPCTHSFVVSPTGQPQCRRKDRFHKSRIGGCSSSSLGHSYRGMLLRHVCTEIDPRRASSPFRSWRCHSNSNQSFPISIASIYLIHNFSKWFWIRKSHWLVSEPSRPNKEPHEKDAILEPVKNWISQLASFLRLQRQSRSRTRSTGRKSKRNYIITASSKYLVVGLDSG